jgi:hypothetical protein
MWVLCGADGGKIKGVVAPLDMVRGFPKRIKHTNTTETPARNSSVDICPKPSKKPHKKQQTNLSKEYAWRTHV